MKLRAFCELVALGLAPVRAAEIVGFSTDSSNLAKRMQRPAMVEALAALQGRRADFVPFYAFGAGFLREGSLCAAYRLLWPCDGLSEETVRARASRFYRRREARLAVYCLKSGFPTTALPWTAQTEEAWIEAALERRAARVLAWEASRPVWMKRAQQMGSETPAPPPEAPAVEKLTGRGRKRCGARARSRGGALCQCKVVPGRTRCKFHGGMSTGPRTPEGKARCVEGARRYFADRRIVSGGVETPPA